MKATWELSQDGIVVLFLTENYKALYFQTIFKNIGETSDSLLLRSEKWARERNKELTEFFPFPKGK